MRTFGVIVLAAGGSKRLDRPKQLLPFDGKTLIERAADTAVASKARDVVVVLGAAAEACAQLLQDRPVRLAFNADWEQGMGGSIACGMGQLLPGLDAVILTLVDQPFVEMQHLKRLASTPGEIVATRYAGVNGVPCLFEASLFPELAALQGAQGARDLIRNRATVSLTNEAAALDIDTEKDYIRALRAMSKPY